MKHHLHTKGFGVEVNPEDEDELIKAMHKRKTAVFIELVEGGKLPLRPGIRRFMKECMDAGLILGIYILLQMKTQLTLWLIKFLPTSSLILYLQEIL